MTVSAAHGARRDTMAPLGMAALREGEATTGALRAASVTWLEVLAALRRVERVPDQLRGGTAETTPRQALLQERLDRAGREPSAEELAFLACLVEELARRAAEVSRGGEDGAAIAATAAGKGAPARTSAQEARAEPPPSPAEQDGRDTRPGAASRRERPLEAQVPTGAAPTDPTRDAIVEELCRLRLALPFGNGVAPQDPLASKVTEALAARLRQLAGPSNTPNLDAAIGAVADRLAQGLGAEAGAGPAVAKAVAAELRGALLPSAVTATVPGEPTGRPGVG